MLKVIMYLSLVSKPFSLRLSYLEAMSFPTREKTDIFWQVKNDPKREGVDMLAICLHGYINFNLKKFLVGNILK
jgi:hypothetical protein